jgi:UDP-3-O-[3-hydroxymyristoyl] glucosamine N-acyltransferase
VYLLMSQREFSLQQLAEKLGAELSGDGKVVVSGIATLQSASSSDISFLANPAYEKFLGETKAGAVIVSKDMLAKCDVNALIHANPYLAYAQLSHLWDVSVSDSDGQPNIHPSATIDASASIDASAKIDAGVVVQSGAVIKKGAIIGANSVVGNDSLIGEGSRLYPGVIVYHGVSVGQNCIVHSGVVLGSDGFGFAPNQGKWDKIAQLGGVVIGDRVEIGANTAIDRGALDNTVIEDGVKLDNLIQIAHNVRVGENTAMAACCAVAGSTTIGKNCIIGGASGIAGHLTVADNIHITAMTMVIKSLKEPGVYSSGTGVQPNAKWKKSIARLRQLDKMAARIKTLEQLNKL